MTVRITTEPAYEPVSLAEARAWCRLESDDTDNTGVLTWLIAAMREYAENYTLRAFVQRDMQLVLSGWPCVSIDGFERTGFELPFPPLVQVSSITYLDTDGVQQTLAPDQYTVHTWREPGVIVPAYGVSWPAVRGDIDSVRVNFTAGYPISGSPVSEAGAQANLPRALKTWVSARLATLFENREQLILNNQIEIPRHFADGLLDGLVMGSRIA